MRNFKEITFDESREIDAGGTLYGCPFGCDYVGSYWGTYWHVLRTQCFKRNTYCRFLWNAGWKCIDTGLQAAIMHRINTRRIPKHAAWLK